MQNTTAPVLVAYATKHGSTEEVARYVAERIRKRGLVVDVMPARDVRDVTGRYGLVILGGAIYSGRWHRDAHRFLKRQRDALLGLPTAVFGMGPREATPEAFTRVLGQLDRALAKHEWLKPSATAVFGGVDPPSRHPERQRDARDWTVIAAWADSAAAKPLPRSRTGAAA